MLSKSIPLIVLSCSLALAEPYLVTATKIYTPVDQAVNSVQIFTQNEIKKYGSTSLSSFLQEESGIYFNTKGAYGGVQTIKHRGLTGFTKIIIDDIEIDDPSDIESTYQLQMLTLDQIESIEVVNGASTALYGTDSVAGVIKINTKKDKAPTLKVGGGSDATKFLSASISRKNKNISYSLSGNYKETEGISSFNKNKVFEAERDSFQVIQVNPSLRYQFNKKSFLETSFFLTKTESEIDGFSSDQRNNDQSDFDNTRFSLKYQSRTQSDRWLYKILLSQSETKRFAEVPSDAEYESISKKIDFYNTYIFNPSFNILFGFDYEYREASAVGSFDNFNEISVENFSSYATLMYNYRLFNSETSYRFLDHQLFGGVNSYKQAFLFPINSFFKVRTSYGHSFRSPTLYQLRSVNNGNADLQPVRVHTYEVGIDSFLSRMKVSLTYFNNSLKNFIGFDTGTSRYFNIERTQTSGVELNLSTRNAPLSFRGNYTYTDVDNESTDTRASNIPREKANLALGRSISDNLIIELTSLYVGKRLSSSIELPSYALIGSLITYSKNKIDYSLQIHNLLNKDYEDTLNFGTRGLSVYGWIQTTF